MNETLVQSWKERRLYYRLDLRMKPLLCFLTNAKGKRRPVKVVNIGGGGLAFSSDRITQVGESCTFELFVGGQKFTLSGRTVSVRIVQREGFEQRVCFGKIQDDVRSKLIRALQALDISLQKGSLTFEETYFYIGDKVPESFDLEESRLQYGKYANVADNSSSTLS